MSQEQKYYLVKTEHSAEDAKGKVKKVKSQFLIWAESTVNAEMLFQKELASSMVDDLKVTSITETKIEDVITAPKL